MLYRSTSTPPRCVLCCRPPLLPSQAAYCMSCHIDVHTLTSILLCDHRQPSISLLTLQAWQLFSTRFILGSHREGTTLLDSASIWLQTTTSDCRMYLEPFQGCRSLQVCFTTGLLLQWRYALRVTTCTGPYHAIDAHKSIRELHACVVLVVPAFLSSIRCKVARFDPRLSLSRTRAVSLEWALTMQASNP